MKTQTRPESAKSAYFRQRADAARYQLDQVQFKIKQLSVALTAAMEKGRPTADLRSQLEYYKQREKSLGRDMSRALFHV
jgi:hypothetical protein